MSSVNSKKYVPCANPPLAPEFYREQKLRKHYNNDIKLYLKLVHIHIHISVNTAMVRASQVVNNPMFISCFLLYATESHTKWKKCSPQSEIALNMIYDF